MYCFLISQIWRPPISTLFPYTTLFRSFKDIAPSSELRKWFCHKPELFEEFGVMTKRSEEHTSELQSHHDLVCRLLLEKKKKPRQSDESDSIAILSLLTFRLLTLPTHR